MTAKPTPDVHFIPSLDYHAWKMSQARGIAAVLAQLGAETYYAWVAHALVTKSAIPVPGLLGNVPKLNGFALIEKPGVYRVELLGPEAIRGKPRTGTPITTIYSFHVPGKPSPGVLREWDQILHDYGSMNRCPLLAPSFITVINHKYEKLDAELTQAVAEISNYIGFAAWLHSTGKMSSAFMQAKYLESLPAWDIEGRAIVTASIARAEQAARADLERKLNPRFSTAER
ncbi:MULTISPECIES: hypothetical protein [unclassified Variovorax]|uniref:hypothetical protein n=1 Tax=unclassified Variovorax TaxID=663243 RepID=UPI00076D8EC1|nr:MULTISPECIES: hypothetical protein [unclassified Variovorax]KWT65018.1 hypothetical protein APY03_7471 [Variovorax sp. WDL1]PNG49114.1 hypothetical protein CHC06_06351 [Variovorax sp. B2]PNG49499.1 hypothetical protein CHC07_06408 [Variovorax sp. B4]VTV18868.1 hypothetical protein WDL1P2_00489 [Variovorax sp. WDL1]